MNLYATVTSERASKGQGGNEFVLVEFTLADKTVIGQIELYQYEDDINHGSEENEWLLKWRVGGDEQDQDWDILTQGHVASKLKQETKGKKQKGERCWHESVRKENGKEICNSCGITLSARIG